MLKIGAIAILWIFWGVTMLTWALLDSGFGQVGIEGLVEPSALWVMSAMLSFVMMLAISIYIISSHRF